MNSQFLQLNQICKQGAYSQQCQYNTLPMQNVSALDKIRGKLHSSIRRDQLQFRFSINRQKLLKEIDTKTATIEKQILIDNLEVVKKAMEWPKESHDLIDSLEKLQNLVEDFFVLNYFLKAVQLDFECERAKNNSNPLQLTWIDLILAMLQQRQDDRVLQLCISILVKITYQLRKTMEEQLINPWYVQQHKRLLQNYPYRRLQDPNCKIVQQSLSFLYNIVVSCDDGSGIYYLLVRITPNILQLLLCVKQRHEFKEIEKEFISTTTMMLFFIKKFELTHLQAQEYDQLVIFVGNKLISNVLICEDEDLIKKWCKLIQTQCIHRAQWLSSLEFQSLEQLYSHQLSNNSLPYFEMMSWIVYAYTFQLSPKTVELLLQKLLYIQRQISAQLSSFYPVIINTLKHHIFNCGNRLLPEDQYTFITTLQSKSKQLAIVARFLEKYNHPSFQSLLKVMSYLIADNQGCELLENQLRPLLQYDEFITILRDLDIQIKPMQSDEL